jgi:IS5 family transposase
MKQVGIFDESEALKRLSVLGDKLEWLNSVLNWEIFEPILNRMKPDKSQGVKGGRPPYANLLMFKVLILQMLYNVSDEQVEYQINDRLSWKRFLGLTLSDRAPDRTTIWDFRELLTNSGCYDALFTLFTEAMEKMGVITRRGSIVDATFEDAPRQRNTKEQNEKIKAHEIPEEWEENEHQLSQKDMEARWAKKGNEVHFGYKNHISCDMDSKMITDWRVTAANVYDGHMIAALIREIDRQVWADSAYMSAEIIMALKGINPGIKLHICEKGQKDHPLTDEQKASNREKSRIRVRIEHIFGHMTYAMGGLTVRCIGIIRAECVIAMRNLAYNLSRYATLRKLKRAPQMA